MAKQKRGKGKHKHGLEAGHHHEHGPGHEHHFHRHHLLGGLGLHHLLHDPRFRNGAITGAALVYVLTNESAQRTLVRGAVKAWSAVEGVVEEFKERVRDARAEIQAEQSKE